MVHQVVVLPAAMEDPPELLEATAYRLAPAARHPSPPDPTSRPAPAATATAYQQGLLEMVEGDDATTHLCQHTATAHRYGLISDGTDLVVVAEVVTGTAVTGTATGTVIATTDPIGSATAVTVIEETATTEIGATATATATATALNRHAQPSATRCTRRHLPQTTRSCGPSLCTRCPRRAWAGKPDCSNF